MSLKSEVRNPKSPVGRFLRQKFPSRLNRNLLNEVHTKLDCREFIRRIDEDAPTEVRGLIGHAVDYRIRLHFACQPVETMTMAWEGAWAVTQMEDLAHALRRSPSRFPDHRITALGGAPDSGEEWQHLADIETEDGDVTIWSGPNPKPDIPTSAFTLMHDAFLQADCRSGLSLNCTLEFLDLFAQTTEAISAHTRTPTAEEEMRLARLLLILSVFEATRRSGGKGWPPEFLGGILPGNAEGLLRAVPDSWAEDAAALGSSFVRRHADWRGLSATLNPILAGGRDVGGADGDIIADGCLWEIKTTMRKRAEGSWLYQLLGYVLLDYEDDHCIRQVGFLFPRQNTSVRWPVSEFIHELSCQPALPVARLRRDLRRQLESDRSWRG